MRLIGNHELTPGRVMWNHLDDIDPALPPHEQESLVGCEDVLTVEYSNDVLLDVSFHSRCSPDAGFVVAVVPRSDSPDPEWQPAVERECHKWDELRSAILELARVAETWKR